MEVLQLVPNGPVRQPSLEYSRNLIFASGAVMERAFDTVVDRTRARLDVPKLRTLFGVGQRPRYHVGDLSPRQAVVIERPKGNLTLFKVHFGLLTLKGYTKGEHVLRFAAIVHNTRALHTGRMLQKFPAIVARLAVKVRSLTGQDEHQYTVRQAAYDLRKLRGKQLVVKPGRTRRYHVPGQAARTIAALLALRDHIIAPILAGVRRPGPGRPPKTHTRIDRDYDHLRDGMHTLFHHLAIEATA